MKSVSEKNIINVSDLEPILYVYDNDTKRSRAVVSCSDFHKLEYVLNKTNMHSEWQKISNELYVVSNSDISVKMSNSAIKSALPYEIEKNIDYLFDKANKIRLHKLSDAIIRLFVKTSKNNDFQQKISVKPNSDDIKKNINEIFNNTCNFINLIVAILGLYNSYINNNGYYVCLRQVNNNYFIMVSEDTNRLYNNNYRLVNAYTSIRYKPTSHSKVVGYLHRGEIVCLCVDNDATHYNKVIKHRQWRKIQTLGYGDGEVVSGWVRNDILNTFLKPCRRRTV